MFPPFTKYQALDCLVTQASPCMAPSYWPITPPGVVRLSVSFYHFWQCSCQQKGWGKVCSCRPDCDWTWLIHLSAWLWKVSLSTGLAILHTQSSHLPGRSPFLAVKACYSATTGSHYLRVLIERLFISGCVRTDLFRIAEISSENSLKCNNMRKLENEVCWSDLEAKNVCEN